jgi:hypothetical protein
MATPVWKNVFVSVPTDGETVWIVRLPYFDTPVQAVFARDAREFTWTADDTLTTIISLNAVFKWRSL